MFPFDSPSHPRQGSLLPLLNLKTLGPHVAADCMLSIPALIHDERNVHQEHKCRNNKKKEKRRLIARFWHVVKNNPV